MFGEGSTIRPAAPTPLSTACNALSAIMTGGSAKGFAGISGDENGRSKPGSALGYPRTASVCRP